MEYESDRKSDGSLKREKEHEIRQNHRAAEQDRELNFDFAAPVSIFILATIVE